MEGFSMSANVKNTWNKVVINQVTDITLKSVNITTDILLNQMMDKIPLKDGKLRKSHATIHATRRIPVAKVVSKGNIAPHNVRQHELPQPANYTTPGTGPKWMENTFRNNSLKTFNRVLKGEMKKNGF